MNSAAATTEEGVTPQFAAKGSSVQSMAGTRPLRPHQTDAIARLRASLLAGCRAPMLQLPTGAGKTVIAAAIVAMAREKRRRVAFCVPALSLIDQTFERFVENGLDPSDMGVIQGDHPWRRPHAPIQICSAQTLVSRGCPQVDLAIIDEAHRRFGVYDEWMRVEGAPVFVGLSATPWAKGLGEYYDDLIKPTSMQELIDLGYLSKFRVFAPTHPDLTGVKTVAGDYHEGQLAERMSKPEIVADVVQTWLAKAEGRSTLCFAVNRAHAALLAERFAAAGVAVAYIDANTPRDERESIGRRLEAGEIKVVCNIGCLTTGVDWDVRCIVMARPTKSEMLFVQIIGRGLRTAPGKDHCIAQGSPVLTDQGLVPIEKVTAEHRLWDGENWVSHGGPVFKGIQRVIECQGIVATGDHLVWSEHGWKTLQECADGQLRIAQTERGGKAVRLSQNCFHEDASEYYAERVVCSDGLLRVLRLRDAIVDRLLEFSSWQDQRMPWMQPAEACAEVVGCEVGASQGSMLQSAKYSIRRLRGAWDSVSFLRSNRGGCMGNRESWVGSEQTNRQDRERSSLRGRQFETVNEQGEHGEQACFAPVWDIINAGPNSRFTVSGRLVHNCLILDHSDTHLRLGMVTDIDHDALRDGKSAKSAKAADEEREERLPRECKSCAGLIPPGAGECPCCGAVVARAANVVEKDGELAEFQGKSKKAKRKAGEPVIEFLRNLDKAELYAQLAYIADERGRSAGWVAHKYKSVTSVWPKGIDREKRIEPSATLRGWVRSQDVAWARAQSAKQEAA